MSTLVLLHAFPLDHRLYDEIVEPIAASGWQVFAPDIRGCGAAPDWSDKTASLVTCAQDVVALLDKYGIDKAVIGGCSLGGYIAMELLRLAPERVAGLILMDTKASADSEDARNNRHRVVETIQKAGTTEAFTRSMLPNLLGKTTQESKPDVVSTVKEILGAANVVGVSALLLAMAARPESFAQLRSFKGPVLSIRGTEDVVSTESDHAEMVAACSDAVHVDIENAGHLTPIEAPEQTSKAIIDFLTSIKNVSC